MSKAITPSASQTVGTRQRLLMDSGWRFHLGDLSTTSQLSDDPHMQTYLSVKAGFAGGPAGASFDDSAWRIVDLPHDFVVEGAFDPGHNMDHGYLPHNVGWYRKSFDVPAEDVGRRLYLEFDGVFRNSTVWVNGHLMGTQPSGYISFRYDVTDVIDYGRVNTVAVRVDAREFEGWWYEGGGIYRHVWLLKVNPLHVAPWGVFVECRPASDALDAWDAIIHTEVTNATDADARCRIESLIVDEEGNAIARTQSSKTLPANTTVEVTQKISVVNPKLWSVDAPHLHRVITTINSGKAIVDHVETTFGFRSIRFDANEGFFLNGKPLKIKGTCNHQDHAGVGVALPDRLHEYRIERLKEMGSNAYRCAHNPPAPELLDACDRLGMLVMDETRHMDSSPQGLFELESMIRRDRNHPSVILWSLGNEEPIQASNIGGRIVMTMKRLAHKLDPTRPVTVAMNGAWGGPVTQVVDVQGCNYNLSLYDSFREENPHKPVLAAEHGSTVCTRGVYVNDSERGYVSAYDVNHPEWAHRAEEAWKSVVERPWMAGTFVWTGFDYRGEPTPYRWPCINSHFGILDTCGFPKDNFYYYQAWWSDRVVLHLLPHWNWAGHEGEPIAVWCHSNCDLVELIVNGVSYGVTPMPRNGHLEWEVPYAPGVIAAKGYKAGRQVAYTERRTTGAPARIALHPDREAIRADGRDIAIVNVSVRDANGLVVPTASQLIRFSISGPGAILGVGNGDPSCHEPDKAMQRSAFNGWCQVIVQAQREPGDIVIAAEAEGLEAQTLVIVAGR
ncbi:MAG: beta-galactosidase GalA [Candidatus Roseilinea sp.]|uniref:beta-galactosidase GalA n=1 Tax=Candidatus Roseilinea sp. TaxID=2838777 RepID=UPI00404B722F